MVRTMMKKRGFTTVEILAVIAILAILLAIIIPQLTNWLKRMRAESDISSVYALIQSTRTKAFTKKESYTITIQSNRVCVQKNGSSSSHCIDLRFNITSGSSTITIDERGVITPNTTIRIEENIPDIKYDCVATALVKVKKGKWDGDECKG